MEASRSAIAKPPIYAALGVPEVWRADGERVTIVRLVDGDYREVAASVALPPLTAEVLTRFLAASRTHGRIAWRTMVRDWARAQRSVAWSRTQDPSVPAE